MSAAVWQMCAVNYGLSKRLKAWIRHITSSLIENLRDPFITHTIRYTE